MNMCLMFFLLQLVSIEILIEKTNRIILILNLFLVLIYIIIFYSVLIDEPGLTRDVYKYDILFYIGFLIYYFNFKEKTIKGIELFKILENFKKLALLSSISNIIAVLIWRYSIYFTYDKKFAGIMIAAFSVASFPGTLANNIVGPSFVKLKLGKNFLRSIKYLLYISLVTLLITLSLNITQENLFYKLVNISLIGTIVLTISIYLKNLVMVNNLLHTNVFKIDILYSISIVPLIVILDKINGYSLASYAYLISGIISLFFYSSLFKKYEKNI